MNKIKIAIIGNCQARPIAEILRKQSDYIDIICEVIVHLTTDAEKEHYHPLLDKADVIITQVVADNYPCKFVTTQNLLNNFPGKVIKINNLFFNGYFPDFRYLRTSKGNLAGPLTDYHSELVLNCYKSGFSKDFTLSAFNKKNIRVKPYTNYFNHSLNELKQRENNADVKICDFLEERLNDGQVLFHTFNHPTSELLVKYANRILDKISIRYDEFFNLDWEPLGQIKLPIVLENSERSITEDIRGFRIGFNEDKVELESKLQYEAIELIDAYYKVYAFYEKKFGSEILDEISLPKLSMSEISPLLENELLSVADLQLALSLESDQNFDKSSALIKCLTLYLNTEYEDKAKIVIDALAAHCVSLEVNQRSGFLKTVCDKLISYKKASVILYFINAYAEDLLILEGDIETVLQSLINALFSMSGFSVLSTLNKNSRKLLKKILPEFSNFSLDYEDNEIASIQHRDLNKDIIAKVFPEEKPIKFNVENAESEHYIYGTKFGVRKSTSVVELNGGYLTLDFTKRYQYCFYFFDSGKNFIPALSYGESPFLDSTALNVKDTVAFCEDRFTVFNICHFLLDKIGRIAEFEGMGVSSYLFFHQNLYTGFINEALSVSQFNINPYKKFKYITFKFHRLLISTSSTIDFVHPAQNFPERIKSQINRLKATVSEGKKHERIFIDRNGGNSRTVLNFPELKELLDKNDFQVVRLEELSVAEQLATFNNAKVVMSVHGAGLTNTMFAPNSVKLIELMPPLCASPSFWKMACGLGLDYYSIICEDNEYPKPNYLNWKHDVGKFNRRDVIVPIGKLSTLLDSIL